MKIRFRTMDLFPSLNGWLAAFVPLVKPSSVCFSQEKLRKPVRETRDTTGSNYLLGKWDSELD